MINAPQAGIGGGPNINAIGIREPSDKLMRQWVKAVFLRPSKAKPRPKPGKIVNRTAKRWVKEFC